jgi:hypothetical protein
MSKFSDFLKTQKIDSRRVLLASKDHESFRSEDRAVRLAERLVKRGIASDAQKATAEKERRSGRPVTRPTLARAMAGGKLSGAARKRLTRAVNLVLKQKKKSEVTNADLF